ncbi:MAG: hypothetical protein GX166_14320 [Clostridiaceae bacterium]|nr:hypothetical protein [Clostridiaceae bacterium]
MKGRLKRSLELKESPTDVILKCLIQTFVAIVVLLPIMNTLARPLFVLEVLIYTFLFTGILLMYTYNKSFRFVIYIFAVVLFILFILFLFSNRDLSPSVLIYKMSNSRIPSYVVVFGITCFLYSFIVIYTSFLMCFLFLAGIVTGVIIAGYGFPVGNFIVLLVALYAIYMLERNSSLYLSASELNRQMIITPPKMTFNMFLSYILIYVLLTVTNIGAGPLLGSYSDRLLNSLEMRFNSWFGKPSDITSELGEIFNLSSMGFGNSGELGGDVKVNNAKMLTVYSDHSGIYLGGVAYEDYNGRKWSSYQSYNRIDLLSSMIEIRMPEMERVFGVNTYLEIHEQRENYKTITVLVRHERPLRARNFFTMSKTYQLDFSMSRVDGYFNSVAWQNEIRDVLFDGHEKLRYNFAIPEHGAYFVQAYVYNKTSPHYNKIMNLATQGYFEGPWIGRPVYLDYESVTSRFPADITTDIFSLSNRSKAFYKKYLQLPSTLPERVRTLAQELTKDAKTDYEKAKVIEQYLKNNYTYTLTPGDVPKGYDFVDYFLFESKEGYCTYYATAMTILLRCVGVPARYVEGFLVTEENYQGGGRFDVLGSNAHAWPEVYLEGIGFVEFEPTASFNGPNPVEIPDASSTPELTPEPTPEPTVEETPSEEPTDAPETTTPKPSPIPDENDNDDLVPVISEAFIKFLKLMLVILAVIALFASVMVLRVKWFFGKITKMDSRSYVIYVFKRM